ncbi:MAG: aminotransferase class III-fold pyridoxal phosphate-dependent enzyme, partial [Syntrophomonas sp.]|nr:aminotransferase class III-fold pyridoxal phosphate-dependent enzyme [Syntrophomonas sp.]
QFQANVQEMGSYLLKKLNKLQDSRIIDVRGKGLMLGIEFDRDIKDLVAICMRRGLLLIGAGSKVLRFVPPLNITGEEIEQAVAILSAALQEWE